MGKLQQRQKELQESLCDNAFDFYNESSISDNLWISDAINDFADGKTSIYYADQKDYYFKHSSDCDEALLEIYDGHSILDLIKKEGIDGLVYKAGAIGEYRQIENDIYHDYEDIIRLLLLDYIIANHSDLDEDKVLEFIDYVNVNENRFSDVLNSFKTEFNL